MAARTVADKARVRHDTRVAVLNGIEPVLSSIGLPSTARYVAAADADIVILFVGDRAELAGHLPTAVDALRDDATIWVVFRKGGKAAGLDMSRNDVWAAAERLQLRPIGLISVDGTWSVFRLRRAEPPARSRSSRAEVQP